MGRNQVVPHMVAAENLAVDTCRFVARDIVGRIAGSKTVALCRFAAVAGSKTEALYRFAAVAGSETAALCRSDAEAVAELRIPVADTFVEDTAETALQVVVASIEDIEDMVAEDRLVRRMAVLAEFDSFASAVIDSPVLASVRKTAAAADMTARMVAPGAVVRLVPGTASAAATAVEIETVTAAEMVAPCHLPARSQVLESVVRVDRPSKSA